MKKTVLLILALMLLLSACGTSTEDPTTNGSAVTPSGEYYIEFAVDSLNVYLYETAPLPINTNADQTMVSYSSTNPSVAVVENNEIKPVSAGSVTITATIQGGVSDTLIVNVADDGNVPFLDVQNEKVSLFENSEFMINAKVSVRGKEVNAHFSFESSDPNVVSVDDKGTITAHKTGSATVNVKAVINGYASADMASLNRSIDVKVLNTVVFDVSAESTIVCTRTETVKGVAYSNETALSGTLLTGSGTKTLAEINCTWISTKPDIASVANNKIVGHKFGETEIYAQVTIDNETYSSNHLRISVEKPTVGADIAAVDIDLSANKIDLPTDYMVNGDKTILHVYDKENPKTDIFADHLAHYEHLGPRTWIIESDQYNYKLDVVVCSKIITTKEELAALHTFGRNVKRSEAGIVSYEGYFILGADIDMDGTRFRTFCGNATGATSYKYNGFIGVFDGRGHIVTGAGVSASDSGLFPTLNADSVVKNVAFVNANVSGPSGLISSNFGGTIENVYVEGKLTCMRASADSPSSLLASKIYDGAAIRQCVVIVTNPTVNNDYSAAIGMLVSAKEDAMNNVFVLGTETKSLATSVGDKYSELKNDGNGQFVNYSDLLSEDLSGFGECWTFGKDGIAFSAAGSGEHTHNISTEWMKDSEKHWRFCIICGERINEAEHSFGEWQITKPASETETGIETRYCTVCMYGESREIPNIQHVHSYEIKSDANNHWTECSCGEKTAKEAHFGGKASETKRAVCSVCGREYGEFAQGYGTVYFGDVIIHDNGYDGVKIRPLFSKPEKCQNEVFEYTVENESVCYIENDRVYFLTLGTTKVTAKSEHFEESFTVSAENFEFLMKANKLVTGLTGICDGEETLFIGDSFFEFWRDGTYGCRKFEDTFGEFKAFNIGISGATTHDWRSISGKLRNKANNPKNIVINLGINNINVRSEDGTTCANNLILMIEDYLEMFPDTHIYYCSLTHCCGHYENNWKYNEETNRIMNEFCDRNDRVHYIDVIGEFGENYADYLISDGLHPSQKGYDVFERLIKEVVVMTNKS